MRIIYVDDERPALENFRFTVEKFDDVTSFELFQEGTKALEYATSEQVDIAFLDMQMPGIHGLDLAVKLHEIDPDMRIVFVTAYSEYALDAWGVDASGYLLKPYSTEDIRKQLDKLPGKKKEKSIVIETMPSLSVMAHGELVKLRGAKVRELFALLVDRGNSGLTAREGISYLWPESGDEPKTQSLFRVTFKRLADVLNEAGAGEILMTSENRRYLKTDKVDCDLYMVLEGDKQAARKYNGAYLQEYSWSEERNAQLHNMLREKNK